MEIDVIDLPSIVLKRVDVKFLEGKLSYLDKQPIFLRHTPRNVLYFVGEILAEIPDKRLDIVLCRNEEEFNNVLDNYRTDSSHNLSLKVSAKFNLQNILNAGFKRVQKVWEKGEFSLLGDVLILWPYNLTNPVRISLLNGVVEKIDLIDRNNFVALENINRVELYGKKVSEVFSYNVNCPDKYKYPLIVVDDRFLEIDSGFQSLDLGFRDISGLDYYLNNKKIVSRIIDEYIKKGFEIICATKNVNRLKDVLKGKEYRISNNVFEKGSVNNNLKVLILSDYELFGQINLGDQNDWLKQIVPGDFLVHEDHGIGIFEGIVQKDNDVYVDIRYAGKDMLLVPVSQSEKVTKYVGGRGRVPTLTSLSSSVWKRTKKKVKEGAENLAKELLQLYAMRKVFKTESDAKKGKLGSMLKLFVDDFKFEDTFDQKITTKEIFNDMTSLVLMDRLLVGDVGFGKTEVAIRAAFLALNMGMQVALLAPTTILVSQHTSVFRKRLEKYNFKIENLSRISSQKEKEGVLEGLESGDVDVVIGTHSLLNNRVNFKNLGLIIIDEEQKFGVKQKERLKQKRVESHVLSMSATPIPRTMSMSLSGIRDISMLFSPPKGRKAILNKFGSFDWEIVKKAIDSEVNRGGQVYFLHNKVLDIHFVEKKLINIFPHLNIGVLHGQLNPRDIAKVMDAFCDGKIDVLISTTIIENGIDLPNVNTLIVDDASVFGLSQLYQIRGRIGRSDVQAYAYFLYKTMKRQASLRLDALMEAQDLGSGFLLANRDLEIRGAGDLLGSAQSGSINSVGYGLFMKFLSEAVEELK